METGRNYNYIKENLETVRAGLSAVAEEAGQKSPPVLIAAVKYADEAEIATLLSSGVTDVGENRVQQLTERAPLYEASGARVHFIGTLQKNKVKYLIGHTALIHSVDSTELAAEIEKRAGAKGLTVDILLEINSACEAGKSGVPAEEAAALFASVSAFTHLRVRGFMTMGPAGADSETYRRCFQKTREVGLSLFREAGRTERPLFSMGMSESYREAVLEGADFVRIGRALFIRHPGDPLSSVKFQSEKSK